MNTCAIGVINASRYKLTWLFYSCIQIISLFTSRFVSRLFQLNLLTHKCSHFLPETISLF